jgi:transcriptional regulator with XRE-family HTH domain
MSLLETGFGERLRLQRLRRALTQLELAQRAGVDETTIVYLEAGVRAPRPSTVRKLARALEIKPLQLTTEE